jgi:glycosyltransferase involved in cell wall biosynthesis
MPEVSNPEISIVTPFFNEEECVGEYYRRVTAALQALGRSYEIVAVSDGSTDETDRLLAELRDKDDHVRCYRLPRNTGQWAALSAGMAAALGERVVIMDGDLQHAPEEIGMLVEKLDEGYDLVSGSRVNRSESVLTRRMPSLVANALLRRVSGCNVRDMGGFKVMRGDLARRLRLRSGQHRFLPALVHMLGGRVGEVSVSAPQRFAGKSKYSLRRTVNVLLDILTLWTQSAIFSRPVHAFGRLSLLLFAVALVMLAWVLGGKLLGGTPTIDRPAFFVALVLMPLSIGLFVVGFLIDILSDIWTRQTGQLPYIVREIPPLKRMATRTGRLLALEKERAAN